MIYNPDTHHRHSIRLKEYDYSENGMYFVTICVENREHLFGEIINENIINHPNVGADPRVYPDNYSDFCLDNYSHVCSDDLFNLGACNHHQGEHMGSPLQDQSMQINNAGKMIQKWWRKLEENFPNVILGDFVIMPNHIHGIIQISANNQGGRADYRTDTWVRPYGVNRYQRLSNGLKP